MSVFQDVTAVPILVVIPVLGLAAGAADGLGSALFWALGKAVLAFALVFGLGRWLLRPFFHLIAARRSAELFTLTVLFVSLLAAWSTQGLGLSMAFGAFLAGMVLGETEFRHQVESTIRPFRDVLLGLFFVGIGMLFDPRSLADVWLLALGGALTLMVVKAVLVTQLVRWSGVDTLTAWRCGLLLAVGGEFGFALLAIALPAQVIDEQIGQIERIPYVALDLDPAKVRDAHAAGEPVLYGDCADVEMLRAVGVERARLLVISYDDVAAALKVLHHVRQLCPQLPVMVRSRDEGHVRVLQEAGATEVVPETLEAGLIIASQVLLMLDVSLPRVIRRIQEQRTHRYRLLRELYRSDILYSDTGEHTADRLHPVTIPPDGAAVGRSLGDLGLQHVAVAALVRQGERMLNPALDTRLQAADVVVLYAAPDDLRRAESVILG